MHSGTQNFNVTQYCVSYQFQFARTITSQLLLQEFKKRKYILAYKCSVN